MNLAKYKLFENFMLDNMKDSAHDCHHIYRVLYNALDIASYESNVDYDVLICACLLHDIGRTEQFINPSLCHAAVGADKAYKFLIEQGYEIVYADNVKSCIKSHRYRADALPVSLEAKILFDADKLDVTGTIGIARTLIYQGHVCEPLDTLDEGGEVSDGSGDKDPSFFKEYRYKLESIYTKFFTKRGQELALERQKSAVDFYENMIKEVQVTYKVGKQLLASNLEEFSN
jgi:uncharacterized protein